MRGSVPGSLAVGALAVSPAVAVRPWLTGWMPVSVLRAEPGGRKGTE